MNKLKVVFSMIVSVMLVACAGDNSRDVAQISNNTSGATGDQNDSNTATEPIEVEGPQVCYNSGVASCHSLSSASHITTPTQYVYPSSGSLQYQKPRHYLDISKLGTNVFVSPNFVRSEFLSLFKGKYGILSPLLVQKVQNMRDSLGQAIKVTSGYRGPAYNKSIGGATFSRHMYGDALDFQSSGKTPSQLKKFCEQQGASYIQVYVSHVHCDWRNESLPAEFYSIQNSILSKVQKFHQEEHDHEVFSENMSLDHSGELRIGSTIRLFVESIGAEESGEQLLREWKIYKNGSLIVKSQNLEQELLLTSGDYDVEVNVGGYWEKHKKFKIN